MSVVAQLEAEISYLKNPGKTISIATPCTCISMSGGIQMGTMNVGFIESDKGVKIYRIVEVSILNIILISYYLFLFN